MILLRKVRGRFVALQGERKPGESFRIPIPTSVFALVFWFLASIIGLGLNVIRPTRRVLASAVVGMAMSPFLINPFWYASSGGGGSAFLTGTTVHTMFPSTQTDIEIWFSFTNSDLKTVANGGHVVNSNHRRFASDSAGTSLYKYDVVTPTATTDSTGLIEGWVLVPSGSSSVDTVFYLAYNDNGVTTYQGDRAGMWARKTFVSHGSLDGSTIDLSDVTGNGNTLTNSNTVTATTGKVGNAANFVAASSQSLNNSSFSGSTATNALTVSAWINLASPGSDYSILAAGHSFAQRFVSFDLDVATNKPRFYFTQGGDNFKVATGATSVTTGAWHYLVGTYDGTTIRVYLDGSQDGSTANTGNVQTGEGLFGIGRRGGIAESFFDGKINAPRVDVVHVDSADRILAQFRNQNAPATYTTWV